MKKFFIFSTITATILISGCDKFKPKEQATAVDKTVSEWSCTHQDNLNQIQDSLKKDYLQQIDRSLRDSGYQADHEILEKINKGLKFEIKNVRTLAADKTEQASKSQLNCESQLVITFPNGLQKRAENAYAEQQKNCEECEGDSSSRKLTDYFSDQEYSLTLENDQLKGSFLYDITKTDKDGLVFTIPNQNAVIDGVVFMATKAVQYGSYLKENQQIEKANEEYHQENAVREAAQTELAQKAMDIRNKELDAEKSKQVDRLNLTWDKFSAEQKMQLQQDQSDWFEKRDIDCKVLSQKNVNEIAEKDQETYQKQSNYWDESMRQQDQQIQYTKCFTQKTVERVVYLNNLN
jgi:hypothetical protein